MCGAYHYRFESCPDYKIKYEVMIKDLIEKLQVKKDYHERMGVIYMWVKQEHITKSMFIELIEEVQKMK